MSTPLGWLQLKHKPLRLLVALAGIGFAVLLIMMQLGFRSALFESAVRFHERFDYDIALFSPDSVFIVRPQSFSIRRLYQAMGYEAVEEATPVYISRSVWKNPWNSLRRSINAVGFHPDDALRLGGGFIKLVPLLLPLLHGLFGRQQCHGGLFFRCLDQFQFGFDLNQLRLPALNLDQVTAQLGLCLFIAALGTL